MKNLKLEGKHCALQRMVDVCRRADLTLKNIRRLS
jgi:hypothetical protein